MSTSVWTGKAIPNIRGKAGPSKPATVAPPLPATDAPKTTATAKAVVAKPTGAWAAMAAKKPPSKKVEEPVLAQTEEKDMAPLTPPQLKIDQKQAAKESLLAAPGLPTAAPTFSPSNWGKKPEKRAPSAQSEEPETKVVEEVTSELVQEQEEKVEEESVADKSVEEPTPADEHAKEEEEKSEEIENGHSHDNNRDSKPALETMANPTSQYSVDQNVEASPANSNSSDTAPRHNSKMGSRGRGRGGSSLGGRGSGSNLGENDSTTPQLEQAESQPELAPVQPPAPSGLAAAFAGKVVPTSASDHADNLMGGVVDSVVSPTVRQSTQEETPTQNGHFDLAPGPASPTPPTHVKSPAGPIAHPSSPPEQVHPLGMPGLGEAPAATQAHIPTVTLPENIPEPQQAITFRAPKPSNGRDLEISPHRMRRQNEEHARHLRKMQDQLTGERNTIQSKREEIDRQEREQQTKRASLQQAEQRNTQATRDNEQLRSELFQQRQQLEKERQQVRDQLAQQQQRSQMPQQQQPPTQQQGQQQQQQQQNESWSSMGQHNEQTSPAPAFQQQQYNGQSQPQQPQQPRAQPVASFGGSNVPYTSNPPAQNQRSQQFGQNQQPQQFGQHQQPQQFAMLGVNVVQPQPQGQRFGAQQGNFGNDQRQGMQQGYGQAFAPAGNAQPMYQPQQQRPQQQPQHFNHNQTSW